MSDRNSEVMAKIGASIIITIVAFVGLVLVLMRADTYLKLKAYNDCGQVSKYTKTDTKNNTVVSYPAADVYKQCLKDTGFSK